MHFGGSDSDTELPDDPQSDVEVSDDPDQAADVDTSYSKNVKGELENPDFPELSEVIYGQWRCPTPQSDDIFKWIESTYWDSSF